MASLNLNTGYTYHHQFSYYEYIPPAEPKRIKQFKDFAANRRYLKSVMVSNRVKAARGRRKYQLIVSKIVIIYK